MFASYVFFVAEIEAADRQFMHYDLYEGLLLFFMGCWASQLAFLSEELMHGKQIKMVPKVRKGKRTSKRFMKP